jgi:hypothetical protein
MVVFLLMQVSLVRSVVLAVSSFPTFCQVPPANFRTATISWARVVSN